MEFKEDDHENWQNSKSQKEKFLYMKENHLFIDIVFLVGSEEKTIAAHKLLLVSGSPVFEKMFNGDHRFDDMAEHYGQTLPVIKIPDTNPEVFEIMLDYLYTEEILTAITTSLEQERIFELYYCAKKYMIEKLENECKHGLRTLVNYETVFEIFHHALFYEDLGELVQLCKKFIKENSKHLIMSPHFHDIHIDVLKEVLKLDHLELDEWNLYMQAFDWSIAECRRQNLLATPENKKKVLGVAFYSIRFPIMAQSEVVKIIHEEPDLLSKDECLELFMWYGGGVSANSKMRFNFRRRNFSEIQVERFNSKVKWGNCLRNMRKNYLIFQANRHTWLVGFEVFCVDVSFHTWHVQAELCISDQALAILKTKFDGDAINLRKRLDFDEPVLIEPQAPYVLYVQIDGPDTYFGTRGVNQYSAPEKNFEINFMEYGPVNESSVGEGQIPCLIFAE